MFYTKTSHWFFNSEVSKCSTTWSQEFFHDLEIFSLLPKLIILILNKDRRVNDIGKVEEASITVYNQKSFVTFTKYTEIFCGVVYSLYVGISTSMSPFNNNNFPLFPYDALQVKLFNTSICLINGVHLMSKYLW